MSLFIVSTPIGNPADITLRAIEILKKVDFLICEEFKVARKLLKRLGIEKELYSLNEHNEEKEAEQIINLLAAGKDAALFSDCGTPLFADPGTFLVQRCHQTGISVIPIPGASSLLSALAVAGVELKQFYYAGFLSRKSEERKKTIAQFKNYRCPVIIYDTPYRLQPLLDDLTHVLSGKRNISLLLALTQPDETILKGSLDKLQQKVKKNSLKKEFVLILEPKFIPPSRQKKKVKTRKRRG
jgi:16S rRNA (cytidine1402-2'-O)-methyltransferase